jgi:hypothetical protein
MTTIDLSFSLQLDEEEYFKVGDHIYTNNEKLKNFEHKLHFCGERAIQAFKKHEKELSFNIMESWSKLCKALDQCTCCCAEWDQEKIIEELISGRTHSVSWYVENCKIK